MTPSSQATIYDSLKTLRPLEQFLIKSHNQLIEDDVDDNSHLAWALKYVWHQAAHEPELFQRTEREAYAVKPVVRAG
ncbi:hypothetical protein EVAR_95548_1 [Eumeta japonica]|uniref:Uncharacterized protein n=1 Tax=Eumeta variegata TaxID=151549 RepID=A0A4C1SLD5_EUMVA|nr:hypothetical protein EVAR_95548_1 [Eumeta japonica]